MNKNLKKNTIWNIIGTGINAFASLFFMIIATRINDVYEAGIGQILDIVHDGGPAGLYLVGKIADVGGLGAFYSQQIEKFLYLGEIFEFYLLDEENIHFGHHVHRFQQILGKVPML